MRLGTASETSLSAPQQPATSREAACALKRKPKGGPTWLFEDGEVGFPTGKLQVGELHDTVVHWVGAEDCVWVICFCNEIQSGRVFFCFSY